MSIDDRLFDELLCPVTEAYYQTAKALGALPVADSTRITRSAKLARLATLEEVGDRIADVLEVARPLWHDMRCFADPVFNEVAG